MIYLLGVGRIVAPKREHFRHVKPLQKSHNHLITNKACFKCTVVISIRFLAELGN